MSKVFRILSMVIVLSMLLTPLVLAEQPTIPTLTDGPQDAQAGAPAASHRLIVELEAPPLAAWYGAAGRARLPNGRLDVQSPDAQAYIAQLEAEQAAFINV